ncbi:UNVERIFIED_CONTAM: hypothetical protein Scaly_0668300 [Sesamum calycinum]|uniref:DUF6821 domain-containing protein n=1 Tax=Sesamum calycinum TaxID=2727403 RepID=A0AAW2RU31_9LAMI
MDLLQGWELLPDPDDDGSLQIHDHGLNTTLLHMDYFICPPQLLPKTIHPPQPTISHLQHPDHQHSSPKPLPIPPAQASARINTSFTTSADQHPVSPDKFYETGLMMTLDSKTTWVIMPHAQTEGGFNIWKWSFNGLGAICSFGVAAATFCLIINFSTHRNKKHPHQNQSLQFQIYNSDKRMKQVIHQASMLSEAGRGVGITTFGGGYYDDAAV